MSSGYEVLLYYLSKTDDCPVIANKHRTLRKPLRNVSLPFTIPLHGHFHIKHTEVYYMM